MRLRKVKRTYGCEINIAPLIDVVFLLIIFFMTVSQISRVEVEDLALPEAEKGETPQRAPAGRFIVNVHKDGRIVVAGRTRSITALQGMLGRELEERSPEDLTVLLRGDQETRWEDIAEIMRVCAGRGIGRVRVAVTEPDASEGPDAPGPAS